MQHAPVTFQRFPGHLGEHLQLFRQTYCCEDFREVSQWLLRRKLLCCIYKYLSSQKVRILLKLLDKYTFLIFQLSILKAKVEVLCFLLMMQLLLIYKPGPQS